jgi:hypothetical protein
MLVHKRACLYDDFYLLLQQEAEKICTASPHKYVSLESIPCSAILSKLCFPFGQGRHRSLRDNDER